MVVEERHSVRWNRRRLGQSRFNRHSCRGATRGGGKRNVVVVVAVVVDYNVRFYCFLNRSVASLFFLSDR